MFRGRYVLTIFTSPTVLYHISSPAYNLNCKNICVFSASQQSAVFSRQGRYNEHHSIASVAPCTSLYADITTSLPSSDQKAIAARSPKNINAESSSRKKAYTQTCASPGQQSTFHDPNTHRSSLSYLISPAMDQDVRPQDTWTLPPSKIPRHLRRFHHLSQSCSDISTVTAHAAQSRAPPASAQNIELCPPHWRLPEKRPVKSTLRALLLKD